MKKKSKNLPKHIYCNIFRRNIYIFYKWSGEKYNAYLLKNYDLKPSCTNDYDGHAFIMTDNESGNEIIVIWVDDLKNEAKNISNLAHEAVHAANLIFEHAGQKIDTSNDELQAYYVGMIIKEVLS